MMAELPSGELPDTSSGEAKPGPAAAAHGRGKRLRKSTTMEIGGHTVLKLNNYTLQDGEPTLSAEPTQRGAPAKPKRARSAFNLFCKDSAAAVAGLPFKDRQSQLGALWREATPENRAQYDALAADDRARFVQETEAYEVALEEHAAAVAAAKEQADEAEMQRMEAEDARRNKLAAERAAKKANKANKANKPAVKRQVSDLEKARLAHNAAIKELDHKTLQQRKNFVRKHADCLRPFVQPGVLKDMCSTRPALDTCGCGEATTGQQATTKPLPTSTAAVGSTSSLTSTPPWINGELRDYQREGVSWLLQTYDNGISAILGDEMGLGKTLQTIAFLSTLMKLRGVAGPFLIVAPLSVLSSWLTEFRKFCPTIRVQKLHSSDPGERERIRKDILPNIANYDVVVTTFEMVKATMHTALARIHWHYLVIDEGHVIKDEQTQLSVALRKIKFARALLLTGTPLQNNMHELWALLNFLYPDIFTSSAAFDEAFKIGGTDQKVDDDMLSKAHFMLRPFMLRRVKADVETTVPPKEEITVFCPLSAMQKFWYKALLLRQASSLTTGAAAVSDAGSNDGVDDDPAANVGKGTYGQLNNLLMQLRKVCCHPFLFPGTEDDPDTTPLEELIEASGKLCVLEKLLDKLQAAGHRVCLFSQFASVLNILEDFVRLKDFQYCRLDGSTNRVQRTVDISSFNAPDSPYFCFLMSTRAGGLGINLQTADTCILFDSDWNPQADLQAMARVHRIGQKKKVHVYRLITRGTVEERMIQRAQKKLYLDTMVNRGSTKNGQKLEKLGTQALMEMLTFGADKIMSADEDKLPSDEDVDMLIDRSAGSTSATPSPSGNEALKTKHGPLEVGTAQTAAGFDANLPLLMTQTLQGETIAPNTLKDIGRAYSDLRGKRQQKSRVKKVGKDSVLKVNDYDLGDNLSVFDQEQARDIAEPKQKGRQIPGRDYANENHCLHCWDGGDLVMCDFCPASYHPSCLGFKDADEMTRLSKLGWSCPQHQCSECGRKAAAAGGLLFRCYICPQAFCEDHLPENTPIVNKNARFLALGQRHPSQACFVLCSDECVQYANTPDVKQLENGAAQASIAGAADGILAGTTNVQAPHSMLPGRIAESYSPQLYYLVKVSLSERWRWSQPRPICRLTLEDGSEHFFQLPENASPGQSYSKYIPKVYNATTLSTLQESELRMWLAANASDEDVVKRLRKVNENSWPLILVDELVPLAAAAGANLQADLKIAARDHAAATATAAAAPASGEEDPRPKRRAACKVDSYDVYHLAGDDYWEEEGAREELQEEEGKKQQEICVIPELIDGAGIWVDETPAATTTPNTESFKSDTLDALIRAELDRSEERRAVQKQLITVFRSRRSTMQSLLRSALVELAPRSWRGWVDGTTRVPHKLVSLLRTWCSATSPEELSRCLGLGAGSKGTAGRSNRAPKAPRGPLPSMLGVARRHQKPQVHVVESAEEWASHAWALRVDMGYRDGRIPEDMETDDDLAPGIEKRQRTSGFPIIPSGDEMSDNDIPEIAIPDEDTSDDDLDLLNGDVSSEDDWAVGV